MEEQLPSNAIRRSPHGERGLKLQLGNKAAGATTSLPSRGAWIEIPRLGK